MTPISTERAPHGLAPGWFLLIVGLLPSCSLSQPQPVTRVARTVEVGKARGPNLLIIMGDDHAGGTLGIDGDPRKATPSLDRLASQGVRFNRAFCNAPVCTASRQSLITGRLPHSVGVTRLPTALPDEATTLGEWFGDFGYATAAYGKMHFNREGAHHGFRLRLDLEEYNRHLRDRRPKAADRRQAWKPFHDPPAVWLNAQVRSHGLPREAMDSAYFVDRATEFFEQREPDDQPFLMVVSFYNPHAPFKFPDEWAPTYRPEVFEAPTISESDRLEQPKVFSRLNPSQIRGIQAAHYTSISYLDFEVGRLVDNLDRAGLGDDTIVVYLGDNGYLLGDHGRFEKHCLYEPAVRVPLIFRWKGHLPEAIARDELVELVDLFPTLLDLTGVPAPDDLHGRSLVDLLHGKPGAKGRDDVFSEYLENEEAMIRTGRYKLIVGTGRRARLDGYETGRPLAGPWEKLFDLDDDPEETTNLIDRADLASVRDELRSRLLTRLAETRNPGDRVPEGLGRMEAIHWCLRPRD